MAPRRVQPGRAKPRAEELATDNEDDEFGFLASQQSSESDDNEYGSSASLWCQCSRYSGFRSFEEAFVERYAGMTRSNTISFSVADLPASGEEGKATTVFESRLPAT
jgi:hypothetical protein